MERGDMSMSERLYVPNLFPEGGLADPHALVEGDAVYVICGHDKSWDTTTTWVMDKWVILKSKDLTTWEKVGEILPTETFIGDQPNCWAGNFKKHNNKYYWFFSNKNFSTGVVVADRPEGPYKDLLGKPLIDSSVLDAVPPYDPVVFYEENQHYIVVGSGAYYIAKLTDDLLGLKDSPTLLPIYNEVGERVGTDDKPSLFKKDGTYYLVWGGKYAISENLYGPYRYLGFYNPGCSEHNDFFEWQGKWYMTSEFPEISHFYRGVGLVEVVFNEDGTMQNPRIHKMNQKSWVFEHSTLGFHGVETGVVQWNQAGHIEAEFRGEDGFIQSSIWPGITLDEVTMCEITMCNLSSNTEWELLLATADVDAEGWFFHPEIDWNEQTKIPFRTNSLDENFQVYRVPVQLEGQRLKRIALKPCIDMCGGCVKIRSIKLIIE